MLLMRLAIHLEPIIKSRLLTLINHDCKSSVLPDFETVIPGFLVFSVLEPELELFTFFLGADVKPTPKPTPNTITIINTENNIINFLFIYYISVL